MYSILLKEAANKFSYILDDTGKPFEGSAETTKTKFLDLLSSYPISKLAVVHSCTITNNLLIEDTD